jgi:hypothetical protein
VPLATGGRRTRPARGIGSVTEAQSANAVPGSQPPSAERPMVSASGPMPPTVSALPAFTALWAFAALAALSAFAALGTWPRLDSSTSAPFRVSAPTSLPRRPPFRTSLLLIELSTMAALPMVAAA